MEIETPEKLLIEVTKILDNLDIKYYVTGGFAVSIWGRPRATFDIDIIIETLEPQIVLLAKALRQISKFGYFDEDMAKEAIKEEGEFNFIHPESGLKVDFWIQKADPFALLQFKRRKVKIISGQKIYFISPEDLVIRKLLWYKESESSRHLEDAESVIKISGKKLDKKYLKKWVTSLGLDDLLKKLITNKSK